MFNKRRFERVHTEFEVELFSQTGVALGKGKATDISSSGMGVTHTLSFPFRTGTEIYLSFQLPDNGAVLSKIRGELRGIEKMKDGSTLLKLRFTEMKVLDIIKEYMEKTQA
ncbi:MAG: PilZ domain-containing protein [Candidatus Firestonebacteria bacterium]